MSDVLAIVKNFRLEWDSIVSAQVNSVASESFALLFKRRRLPGGYFGPHAAAPCSCICGSTTVCQRMRGDPGRLDRLAALIRCIPIADQAAKIRLEMFCCCWACGDVGKASALSIISTGRFCMPLQVSGHHERSVGGLGYRTASTRRSTAAP